jgi:hypothetical protein
LPPEIQALPRYQAVFAREPAFDSAIATMMKSIADDHGWTDVAAAPTEGRVTLDAARTLLPSMMLLAVMTVATLWLAGRVILWLAVGEAAAGRPFESAFWHGLRYALATSLWSLGPYLVYGQVAEVRARARLPIRNLHGMLTVANATGALVLGGTFLLLSTLPGWRLQPLGIFPAAPRGVHYAMLAAGLLGMVVLAAMAAVWEPRVRSMTPTRREWGMRAINSASLIVVAFLVWFAFSLAASLPAHVFALQPTELVPMIGYPALCLATLPLLIGYGYAGSRLGLHAREWHNLALFILVLGLMIACTLALFAYGPTRVLAGDF